MKMIIGGAYQGKLMYARQLYEMEEWEDGAVCDLDAVYVCSAMNHFHLYVRRLLDAGMDVSSLAADMIEKNPEMLLISTEIGYGVVSIDKADREFRETLGRICTELAGFSTEVHRVVCGIGMVIKGD